MARRSVTGQVQQAGPASGFGPLSHSRPRTRHSQTQITGHTIQLATRTDLTARPSVQVVKRSGLLPRRLPKPAAEAADTGAAQLLAATSGRGAEMCRSGPRAVTESKRELAASPTLCTPWRIVRAGASTGGFSRGLFGISPRGGGPKAFVRCSPCGWGNPSTCR